MKLFVLLILVGAALAKESYLNAILLSADKTDSLYSEFKLQQDLHFDKKEDSRRKELFIKSAKFVASQNSVDGETAEFALNFMSTLTEAEKKLYMGVNMTGIAPNPPPRLSSAPVSLPSKKMWLSATTRVTNQGGCGSCWTYSAIGAVETQYKTHSGVLRKFSEQEFLDCTYDKKWPGYDGCNGGWMYDAFEYSKKSGRLASAKDYPYRARDSTCSGQGRPNSLVAAKISGYVKVPGTEQANIEALTKSALSVALETSSRFHSYRRGVLRDTTCGSSPTHAIVLVGYTPEYVLAKNSWGSHWGDGGFIKFARNHFNCAIWQYTYYPVMKRTGRADNSADDPATDYKTNDGDDEADPDCKDSYSPCYVSWCKHAHIRKDYCQKTCNSCGEGEDNGKCPSGTTRCPDGTCKHVHMC